MNNKAIGILFITVAAALPGCTMVHNEVMETEMEVRNCLLAQKAWGHWSWCYGNLDHPTHFARGFKAGYRDILEGGSGCQPTLPPECYWKPCFQTPAGRCKTYAWFDGFSHGALAAKQDGYGGLGEIPISPRVRENLRLANSVPGQPIAMDASDELLTQPLPTTDEGNGLSPAPLSSGDAGVDDGNPAQTSPNSTRPYDE